MARPLNKKVIKDRIKENKRSMGENKKAVTSGLQAGTKGVEIDAPSLRAALAMFIKSANAVRVDSIKLNSIGE